MRKAIAICAPSRSLCSGKQVELRWNELGSFIAARQIKAVLTDGTYIKGRALAVNPDALILDKKGRTSIPRDSLSTISFTETKGVAGRITLTLVGTLACGVPLAYSWHRASMGSSLAAFIAG
jgi:hypothetical protein